MAGATDHNHRTEIGVLSEAERAPLQYADRTIRNAHRIGSHVATLRIAAGDWSTVDEYVQRLLRDRQREWEAAVLRRCVETMPATGEAPDFLSVVTTAMLVLRESRCPYCGHCRGLHYALGHTGCHDLRCACERVFPSGASAGGASE